MYDCKVLKVVFKIPYPLLHMKTCGVTGGVRKVGTRVQFKSAISTVPNDFKTRNNLII